VNKKRYNYFRLPKNLNIMQTLQTFPIKQAKNQFSKLLDLAAGGQDVCVSKHGKPFIKLVAYTASDSKSTPSDTFDDATSQHVLRALKNIRSQVKSAAKQLNKPNTSDWQAARDDGRRV
jgi:prevent-host-death family protein